ncbi:PilN domain-containing protein [Methylophilus sp. UBA6697]|uniref:PilN domain-containing protein n=1 Tax=Methylophilus sp. UBA6697 TaxID=1946902 RepID=UPI000EBA4636|nr:PilN domain-containing protein [Methylophilus sp. UBA6697]HCU84532.1 hypothetical protein [Methylophilus sp.]
MSQQINLFEGGLVKSKDWFNLPFVVVIYVLAAGVMFYLSTGLEAENAALQTQRNQAVTQYETMQKKVDQFAQRVTPIDNSKLEVELKTLKGRFDMQSQILAIFQQSISDASNHLVDYMRAFTAQQQAGLWLTGFRIEPGTQHISLTGQALQSEAIPQYLDLLSAQRIFEGTQFSGIQFKQVELQRPQSPATAPAAAASPPAAVPESTPAGKGAPYAASNAAPASVAPPATASQNAHEEEAKLQVYAFEVKGRDLQSQAKRENSVSWDDFVRQTTQAQPTPGK